MFYRLLHHFQHSIKLTDSADFSIHHSNPSWAKIFPKNHSFLIMIKSYKLHDIMLAFKNLLNTKYRFDLPLRLHWDWPIDLPKSVNELSVELLQLEKSGISVGVLLERRQNLFTLKTHPISFWQDDEKLELMCAMDLSRMLWCERPMCCGTGPSGWYFAYSGLQGQGLRDLTWSDDSFCNIPTIQGTLWIFIGHRTFRWCCCCSVSFYGSLISQTKVC